MEATSGSAGDGTRLRTGRAFLVCGALVMWMAAGFVLESGLVRTKAAARFFTKNVGLYSIACIMYMLVGYSIMSSDFEGGVFQSLTNIGVLGKVDADAAAVAAGDAYYSTFFQVVFVATAMSIVSGAVAGAMKLWSFFAFTVVLTGFIYPVQGFWKWGSGWLNAGGFLDFAGSGVVHMCGAAAALAGVLLLGLARASTARGDGSTIRCQPATGGNRYADSLARLVRLQWRFAATSHWRRQRQRCRVDLRQHEYGRCRWTRLRPFSPASGSPRLISRWL